MSTSRHSKVALVLAFALFAVVALVPRVALADTDPITLTAEGVSDFTTDVKVQKLASDTHEPVVGAHLQIIEKSSGSVVEDWTTDGSMQQFKKVLNVDTTYTLHEVSAPDGFKVANDVNFTINATDGEVTLLGDTNADNSEVVDKQTLNLYDVKGTSEVTVTKQAGFHLPQTGDVVPYLLIGALLVAGAIIVVLGLRGRRNKDDEDETDDKGGKE
jgi:LPXTG-motif cell wall-anchored protein